MKSKIIKFAFIIGIFAVSFSTPSYSQTEEEMKVMQELAVAEVRLIFIQSLNLSKEEGDAFWPIYDAYRAELLEVGQKNSELISDFAAHYQNMTDEVAGDLTTRYFANEEARLAIRIKYREKMAKVLSPIKVAKFVQIENKLIAIGQYQLASHIPLMQE